MVEGEMGREGEEEKFALKRSPPWRGQEWV